MVTLFGNYGITDWDIHKDIPQIDVANLYPKTLEIQTYNPNPNWNKTWASFKDQLKVNKSYKPDFNNVTKEDIKVQFKKFEEAVMKPIHLQIDEMVMKRLQEEKEKIMKNSIEYIRATLRTIAVSNKIKVIIEYNAIDNVIKAAFYDSARFEKTQVYILFVNDLEKDWELVLDGKIRDAFGKDIGRGGFTYIDTDMAFKKYCKHDVEGTKDIYRHILNSVYGAKGEHKPKSYFVKDPDLLDIDDVKFNGPATIVFWNDGTKTVVKAHNEDIDYEKGLAMAISKKFLGNKGNYFNEFKKWLPEEEEEILYPKINIPSLSDLFKPKEFSFEVISTSINGDVLKELTRGAGNQTVQMTFEGIMKTPEKEPERVNSKEFIEIAQYCEFRRPGYGWHGDNHTIIEEYCEHTDCLAGRGDYCCEQNCPRFALKKGEK